MGKASPVQSSACAIGIDQHWSRALYCPRLDNDGSTCVTCVGRAGVLAAWGLIFTGYFPPTTRLSFSSTSQDPSFCSRTVVSLPLPREHTSGTPPVSARASPDPLRCSLGSSPGPPLPWHNQLPSPVSGRGEASTGGYQVDRGPALLGGQVSLTSWVAGHFSSAGPPPDQYPP